MRNYRRRMDGIQTEREADEDTDIDNQGEHNEKHKQDQLQKQKDGKGHWKPELASNSEEAVSVFSFHFAPLSLSTRSMKWD